MLQGCVVADAMHRSIWKRYRDQETYARAYNGAPKHCAIALLCKFDRYVLAIIQCVVRGMHHTLVVYAKLDVCARHDLVLISCGATVLDTQQLATGLLSVVDVMKHSLECNVLNDRLVYTNSL
ncbi:hypothetical protein ABBQ38_003905 [Trebouxia sp. C0009 RCD-2024]